MAAYLGTRARRAGWGYYVSPAQREREIAEEQAELGRIDARLEVGMVIPPDEAGYWLAYHWALQSRDQAAACGLDERAAANLASYLDVSGSWVSWIPTELLYAEGYYSAAEETEKALERRFGDRPLVSEEQERDYRRRTVAQIGRARRALGKAR
jgi:hypothetical protein